MPKKLISALLLLTTAAFYIYTIKTDPGGIPPQKTVEFTGSIAIFIITAVAARDSPFSLTTALLLGIFWAAAQIYYNDIIHILNALNNPYLNINPESAAKTIFYTGLGISPAAGIIAEIAAANHTGTTQNSISNIPLLTPKKNGDIEICRDKKTKKPVTIKGIDRYLGTMVVGPPGCGKTSRVIKPMIIQDLKRLQKGEKLGITVIEPKGDLVGDIAEICEAWDIPYIYINPENQNTKKFNPLQGDIETVAEATRTVLKNIFGRQEAFFSLVQETSARNTVLLLKKLLGDRLDMLDVIRALRPGHSKVMFNDGYIIGRYESRLSEGDCRAKLYDTFGKHIIIPEGATKVID